MVKKHIGLYIVTIILSLSGQLSASEHTFNSVEDLVVYGLKNNTELQAQQHKWEAAGQLPKKLSRLSDPMVGVRLNGNPAKNPAYTVDQKRYIIQQTFPFSLGLKQLGKTKEATAYLNYLIERNNLIISIQNTYYQLILNQDLVRIIEKNKAIMTRMFGIADVKYQSGQGLQANVIKTQIALSKLDEQYIWLRHQKIKLNEALKQRLSLPFDSIVTVPLNYSLPVKTISTSPTPKWLENALSVKKSKSISEEAKKQLSVEKSRYLPKVSAQLEYWDNSGMEDQTAGQVMMSIPWITGKNLAAVREAKQLKLAKDATNQDVESDVMRQLTSLVSEINATAEILKLYETRLLRDAALSFSNYSQAFEVDKASFIDYFDAEKTLFEIEKDYAVLKNQYHRKLIELKWQFEEGEIPYEKI